MNNWPKVRLGEVLQRTERYEPRNELIEYPFAGTYSFARGIFVGESKMGAMFSLPKIQRIRKGDFVYCKIMAWEGAFGLVPKEADDCVMSNAFVVYKLKLDRIDPRFLDYFFKVSSHWKLIGSQSTGTNVRRQSLHPMQFEKAEIPLPTLSEQRRIVALIEELAAQINEARTLREQADEEAEASLVSMAHRADLSNNEKERLGWLLVHLSEAISYVDESIPVITTESYPNFGIYSFGRGLFPKPPIEGTLTSAKSLRRARGNQFIYSRLFAFEGAYGMVTSQYDGAFISNEYPTFNCDPQLIRPEFLVAYFKSPTVWKTVATGSKGLGDRRQRVQPAQVLAHQLWLPPLSYQNRLAEIKAEMDTLKHVQVETAAELDALLPAILDRAFKGDLQIKGTPY
jgi:type I restriction enzyme, S subunit